MSVWTHVCGNIYLEGADKKLLDSLLGKMDLWEDDDFGEKSEDNPIPSGSEGSLHYKIIEVEEGIPSAIRGNDSYYSRGVIAIWGDLRNYSNTEEIKNWFENIIYNDDVFIRQAVLQVQCMGSEIIEYDGNR